MYASAASEAVLGHEPTAEVGRDLFEFVNPDDLDSLVASFTEPVAPRGTRPPTRFRMRSAGADWPHVETMGYHVSFNLSGVSLDDPATLDAIAAALEATGAPPDSLTCQITETVLMRHGASGEELVRSIRALGCGIALDDFGVGFGGHAYLKALPVTAVSIDREFVLDETASRHVIQALVSLYELVYRVFSWETLGKRAPP